MPEHEAKRKMLKIHNMTEIEAEEFAKSIKIPRLHTYRYTYWDVCFWLFSVEPKNSGGSRTTQTGRGVNLEGLFYGKILTKHCIEWKWKKLDWEGSTSLAPPPGSANVWIKSEYGIIVKKLTI